jgi:hypothetical protein
VQKVAEVAKQIQEKQRKNLECRTEAKQLKNETKIYLTCRKTKSIKQ